MNFFKPTLAASALALFIASGAAQAADIAPTSDCYLAGDGSLGIMYNWQTLDTPTSDEEPAPGDPIIPSELDNNWLTPFAEGRGLISCGAFNFQGDFAYYDHLNQGKDGPIDLDQTNSHFGGALFWRDQNVGLLGLTGSYVMQDLFLKDADYLRAGLIGEYFVNDQLTLGMNANYFNGGIDGKDWDNKGFELAANAKYYATPNLSFKLEGALLSSKYDESDLDGFSVSVEGEHLIWDQGLSIFGGGRFAKRDVEGGDIRDLQVFAGIKLAFGGNTQSLLTRDRSGPVDHTSIFLEKLPDPTTSYIAGLLDSGVIDEEPEIIVAR